ncbi:MAG TPA: molybdopterin molybdotransferase MoeA, partial [Candidatus Thermoplasmatota archaeon]|nr:molybdopterin molybdotransferase MoeA [Candidatus Thermoplasmatota archaeon]
RLRVAQELFAGARRVAALGAGEAARIATGAPVPEGADAVVRVEDTKEDNDIVVISRAARRGESIERAGSDLAKGSVVVRAGEPLTPARLGLLASVGATQVEVLARPRVALFTSGDEVVPAGETLAPGQIHDSNGPALTALLEGAGAEVDARPALPDDLARLADALAGAARGSDLALLTGGASVGAKDLVVDALRAKGEVLFHGVRVKPGKPLLAGRVGDALVIGLPGNPASALSNACLFVLPALRRLAGLPQATGVPVPATLAQDVAGEPERYLFLPVRLEDGLARPTFKTSGALTSLAASDGWIGVPEGAKLPAGARVDVHPW